MVAYFSSKFKKQIQSVFAAALLIFCLLGTHWVGLSHSISHTSLQGHSIELSKASVVDKSFNHSSDTCHLFDALSLAGFIASEQSQSAAIQLSALDQSNANHPFLRNVISSAYQSRAPPTFTL